jgi:hypothetical protein
MYVEVWLGYNTNELGALTKLEGFDATANTESDVRETSTSRL